MRKPQHLEIAGCIVNIREGLHDVDGNEVTSIEILCDHDCTLPDLGNARSINVRVVKARS